MHLKLTTKQKHILLHPQSVCNHGVLKYPNILSFVSIHCIFLLVHNKCFIWNHWIPVREILYQLHSEHLLQDLTLQILTGVDKVLDLLLPCWVFLQVTGPLSEQTWHWRTGGAVFVVFFLGRGWVLISLKGLVLVRHDWCCSCSAYSHSDIKSFANTRPTRNTKNVTPQLLSFPLLWLKCWLELCIGLGTSINEATDVASLFCGFVVFFCLICTLYEFTLYWQLDQLVLLLAPKLPTTSTTTPPPCFWETWRMVTLSVLAVTSVRREGHSFFCVSINVCLSALIDFFSCEQSLLLVLCSHPAHDLFTGFLPGFFLFSLLPWLSIFITAHLNSPYRGW